MKLSFVFRFVTVWLVVRLQAMGQKPDLNVPIKAKLGQFPFMAQIAQVMEGNSTHSKLTNICGASLITRSWIISAGQCFPNTERGMREMETGKSTVVIMHTITNLDFSGASQRRFIKKIVRHPDYQNVKNKNKQSVSADIAVAKVERAFVLTININSIFLASQPTTATEFSENETCVSMGYGEESEASKDDHKNSTLMFAYIKMESADRLGLHSYPSNVLGSRSSQGGKTFHGDTGSPVVCINIQYAIVSSVVATKDGGFVDTYTQVGLYRKFIQEHVPHAVFTLPMRKKKRDAAKSGAQRNFLASTLFFALYFH